MNTSSTLETINVLKKNLGKYFHWQHKVGNGLCSLWWTPKCSIIKVLTTVFWHVLYTYIEILDFDIRVKLNMFLTFVVIMAQ